GIDRLTEVRAFRLLAAMSFEEVELPRVSTWPERVAREGLCPCAGRRSWDRVPLHDPSVLTAVSARIESDSMIHRRPAVRKQRHRLPLSFFTRKITKDRRPDPNAKPDVALAHDRESALAHRDGGRTALTTVRRSCRPEGVLC